MLINVPQYIDIEDKIAGPLTAKQLGWIMLLGILLLIFWNVLPKMLFFIVAIPLGIFLLGLAFYRPYGQPLSELLFNGAKYMFRPKVYIWKRTPEKMEIIKQAKEMVIDKKEKRITAEELREISELLDSEGERYDQKVTGILKENKQPKKFF
jgi:hypothetical protein